MSSFKTTAPCGCAIWSLDEQEGYRYELEPCALHGAARELRDACRAAFNYFAKQEYPADITGKDGRIRTVVLDGMLMALHHCREAEPTGSNQQTPEGGKTS